MTLPPLGVAILASALLLPSGATAAVSAFLNRAAFETTVSFQQSWDFENLETGTQHIQVSDPGGSITIPFALANPLPASAVPPATTLSGTVIYFNPQGAKAFEFTPQVSAFGISIIWSPTQNPDGVGLELFDSNGGLLATVTTNVADSLSGPFTTSAGDTYEGFLGFTSDTPVSSIRFNHLEGSIMFDNPAWTSVPEPSQAALLSAGLIGFLMRRRR
ncbi:PEP-CTERM sorting domain-containing protein [Luteolibacter sp. GHJ8]|uniref:PEP-CTERM sorting domain-containing protein n=1 Tax=Luteolibacter rhizosphaerae TaxID=2989719 RepID=A0ABT3FZP0_9BACT|nr:PEP-CTERM sorting domain-containing protein [Luteolibacter rhizosphaerae]MCW1913056.1 PEP-CTERM sorting domain-containing protein [Luteolibacter rhizosphaerae]